MTPPGPREDEMDDARIDETVERLVGEEHELWEREADAP